MLHDAFSQAFNDFRRKRPWISPKFLQPKGIALELPFGNKKTYGDAGVSMMIIHSYAYIYIMIIHG